MYIPWELTPTGWWILGVGSVVVVLIAAAFVIRKVRGERVETDPEVLELIDDLETLEDRLQTHQESMAGKRETVQEQIDEWLTADEAENGLPGDRQLPDWDQNSASQDSLYAPVAVGSQKLREHLTEMISRVNDLLSEVDRVQRDLKQSTDTAPEDEAKVLRLIRFRLGAEKPRTLYSIAGETMPRYRTKLQAIKESLAGTLHQLDTALEATGPVTWTLREVTNGGNGNAWEVIAREEQAEEDEETDLSANTLDRDKVREIARAWDNAFQAQQKRAERYTEPVQKLRQRLHRRAGRGWLSNMAARVGL